MSPSEVQLGLDAIANQKVGFASNLLFFNRLDQQDYEKAPVTMSSGPERKQRICPLTLLRAPPSDSRGVLLIFFSQKQQMLRRAQHGRSPFPSVR